jgi:hypothetical protein
MIKQKRQLRQKQWQSLIRNICDLHEQRQERMKSAQRILREWNSEESEAPPPGETTDHENK